METRNNQRGNKEQQTELLQRQGVGEHFKYFFRQGPLHLILTIFHEYTIYIYNLCAAILCRIPYRKSCCSDAVEVRG